MQNAGVIGNLPTIPSPHLSTVPYSCWCLSIVDGGSYIRQMAPALQPLRSQDSILCPYGNLSDIQTLNNYVSRWRLWMMKFQSVGPDYLKNHLVWFRVCNQESNNASLGYQTEQRCSPTRKLNCDANIAACLWPVVFNLLENKLAYL